MDYVSKLLSRIVFRLQMKIPALCIILFAVVAANGGNAAPPPQTAPPRIHSHDENEETLETAFPIRNRRGLGLASLGLRGLGGSLSRGLGLVGRGLGRASRSSAGRGIARGAGVATDVTSALALVDSLAGGNIAGLLGLGSNYDYVDY